MSITSKIAKHYQSAIGGEMLKYHCPEWDTDIYYRKTYPLKDEAKVLEFQANGKTIEALVESIIVKARDKNGQKLFTDADRVMLMNESDPKVVVQVATQINNARLQLTQEQAAKE